METLFLIREQILKAEPAETQPPVEYEMGCCLSPKNIRILTERIEQWAMPVGSEWIREFNRRFLHPEQGPGPGIHLINYYVELIRPHAAELGFLGDQHLMHSQESLATGLGGLIAVMTIYWSQYGGGPVPDSGSGMTLLENLPHLFNYVILYLYVDHYFDDPALSWQEKSTTLAALFVLIQDTEAGPVPAGMSGLLTAYKKLLQLRPAAKPFLINSFMTEAVGLLYQKSSEYSRQEYLLICERKGGRTATAIQSIYGGDINPDIYNVGACVQLLDDMADVYDDQKDSVNTIATYDLKHEGSLDRLIIYTTNRIYHLSKNMTLIKIMMMECLTYIIGNYPCVSLTLKRRLRGSIHFYKRPGHKPADVITGWIRQAL